MSACRYLEEELAQRYRDAAPATLTLLQRRCEDVAAELVAAEQQLASASDVPSLRRTGTACGPRIPERCVLSHLACTTFISSHHQVLMMCCACAAMQHVFSVAAHVHVLLDGATDPDPAQYGLTTDEERAACATPQVSLTSHLAGSRTER